MPSSFMIALLITQGVICFGVLIISGAMIYKVLDDCKRRAARRARIARVKNGGL